jgi:hypothetical protein
MTFTNSLFACPGLARTNIFQEDSMKNGICFLGLPHPPQRGVEFAVSRLAAAQTPMASLRLATTTVGAVIASEAKQSTVRSDSHGLLRTTTTVGVCGKPAARLAAQTPETTAERLSKRFALATPATTPPQHPRNNGLTLSKTPCYDVEAVREAPDQRYVLCQEYAEPGLFSNVFMLPL